LGGIACLILNKFRKGGRTLNNLYVGIDISKESSSAQGIDAKGEKQFYLKFDMDSDGFSQVFKAIRKRW